MYTQVICQMIKYNIFCTTLSMQKKSPPPQKKHVQAKSSNAPQLFLHYSLIILCNQIFTEQVVACYICGVNSPER